MTVAVSKAVRAALKAAGYGKADVSVHNDSYSMGSTVYVKIKRPEISLLKVEAIAESFARVDRDSSTGEILGGGNCFVDVGYADGALDAAAARINEQVTAGRRHFGQCELVVKDPFTYQVWHNEGDDERDNVGRAGMHIDREKPGPGLARELAKIGQLDTLDQWAEAEPVLTRDEQDAAERALEQARPANGNDVEALVERSRDVAREMFGSEALLARFMNEAASLTREERAALVQRITDAAAQMDAPPTAEDIADALHGALEPAMLARFIREDAMPHPADITRDGAVVTLTACGGVYRISVERIG